MWADVRDGILVDMSVGYEISEYSEDTKTDTITVTRWTPLEGSFVSVPADPTVGANRSKEGTSMAGENGNQQAGAPADGGNAGNGNDGGNNVADNLVLLNNERKREQGEGAKQERARARSINALFDRYQQRFGDQFEQLRKLCLDAGVSEQQAREQIEAAMLDGQVTIETRDGQDEERQIVAPYAENRSANRPAVIARGGSVEEKMSDILTRTLLVRAGYEADKDIVSEVDSAGYRGLSLMEMGAAWIHVRGGKLQGDKMTRAGIIMQRAGVGLADFPAILANVSHKAAMVGYMEAPETWHRWCKVGNLNDFKQAKRVTIGAFPELDEIPATGEYKYAKVSDVGENIQLATYGKKFRIPRQAIINDDMSFFTEVPRKMGRAAARTPGNLAYGILTANAALGQDDTELFHADHNNLQTGAAMSVDSFDTATSAMALQVDPDGNAVALNIEPSFLLVPRALRSAAKILVGSEKDPTYDAANPRHTG